MRGRDAPSLRRPRTDLVLRWIAALPLTFVAAILTMASTPLWWPKGTAGIDNLVFSILLFPAFWAIYVFYSLLDSKPVRVLVVLFTIILANALIIYRQF
jgi:hypothetical protein